jgi:hypothetical protein
MKKPDELELEIMNHLKKIHPQPMSLMMLKTLLCKDSETLKKYLEELKEKVIVYKAPSGFTYCKLPDTTTTVGRDVICPKCKTVKKIFRLGQVITPCDNPKCKTPSGNQTKFWVINRTIEFKNKGRAYYNSLKGGP